MKFPYIVIARNRRFAEYEISPDHGGIASVRACLFRYSVTCDATKLPTAIFVLTSLPAGVKTKIGKMHRAGDNVYIDLFIDENWKFSLGMRTGCSQWYFCGKPIPGG